MNLFNFFTAIFLISTPLLQASPIPCDGDENFKSIHTAPSFFKTIMGYLTQVDHQNLSLVSKFWNSVYVEYFNKLAHKTLTFDRSCTLEDVEQTLGSNKFSKVDISRLDDLLIQKFMFQENQTGISYVRIQNILMFDYLSSGTTEQFEEFFENKRLRTAQLLISISLHNLSGLKVLNIGCNQLSLEATTAIATLKNLEEIHAYACGLTNESLYPFTTLPNLLILDAKNNLLSLNDPRGLPFAKLQTLLVDENDTPDGQTRKNLAQITSLETLRINSNGIADSPWEEVTELKTLKELLLIAPVASDHTFTIGPTVCFSTLCGLPTLEKFQLDATFFKEGDLPHLKRLHNLKALNLNYSTFEAPLSLNIVGELTGLKFLSLGQTNLSGLDLRFLMSLPMLEGLHVQECGLGVEALPAIGSLLNLRELFIGDNNFLNSDLKDLKDLTELRTFNVSHLRGPHALDNPGCLETIGRFTNLRTLNITGNTFCINNNLQALRPLTSLRKLILATCMVNTQEALDTIGSLTNLTVLTMSSNPLPTHANMMVLNKLQNLVRLYISNCNLNDQVLDALVDLPKLRYLEIIEQFNHIMQLSEEEGLVEAIPIANEEEQMMNFQAGELARDTLTIRFNPTSISQEALNAFQKKCPLVVVN